MLIARLQYETGLIQLMKEMVTLQENEVVITISHPSPADFLSGLQTGIIEMVKSLLSVGGMERTLVLDTDTTEGCICALELVQATLAILK